jgi:hypothetical protein
MLASFLLNKVGLSAAEASVTRVYHFLMALIFMRGRGICEGICFAAFDSINLPARRHKPAGNSDILVLCIQLWLPC